MKKDASGSKSDNGMSARSCATLANQGRDVAAADDSVSLCQVRENDYKAVNRPVHERARKSAISHWHGESQPSIAPLVRLVRLDRHFL